MDTRPAEPVTLHPWALCTLDEATTYLKFENNDKADLVRQAINDASDLIETKCGRKLKSRVYDGTTYPALLADGTGEGDILCPEWPITALSAADYKMGDLAGTWVALNIANWYEVPNGILELPFSAFPCGRQNIRLKLTAGYVAGVHDRQLGALSLACRRMVQVGWVDRDAVVGRGTGFSVGGQSISLVDTPLPKDVEALIAPFVRFY